MAQRYRLVCDDDSHWYVVPVDRVSEFNKLCAAAYAADEFEKEFNDKFGDMAIGGAPCLVSFTDPKAE